MTANCRAAGGDPSEADFGSIGARVHAAQPRRLDEGHAKVTALATRRILRSLLRAFNP